MHVDDHEECSHFGCGFSACAGVMKEHRLIHSERVQKWMSMTPEEIEQWRAERRRNWPTEENVKRKEEEKKAEAESKKRNRQEDDKEEEEEGKAPAAKRMNARQQHQQQQQQEKRMKPQRPSLLRSLFTAERNVEADLLIQCFEHWVELSKANVE